MEIRILNHTRVRIKNPIDRIYNSFHDSIIYNHTSGLIVNMSFTHLLDIDEEALDIKNSVTSDVSMDYIISKVKEYDYFITYHNDDFLKICKKNKIDYGGIF